MQIKLSKINNKKSITIIPETLWEKMQLKDINQENMFIMIEDLEIKVGVDYAECKDHTSKSIYIKETNDNEIKTIIENIIIDKKKIINKNMIKLNTNIFINNHFKGYLKGETQANNNIVEELENIINKL